MKGNVGAATMIAAVVALNIGAISSAAGAGENGGAAPSPNDPSRFSYARLYCTPDNETHFAEVTIELAKQNFAPPAAAIYIGGNQQTSSAFLAGFEPHWGASDLMNHLYHPTPAVQTFAVAEGVFTITATDGETRELHAGDVVRLEDVSPCKGHITVVGDKRGFLLFAR